MGRSGIADFGGSGPPRPQKSTIFGRPKNHKPYEFIGFGAMDATKPYEFIGFGAMDATKPLKTQVYLLDPSRDRPRSLRLQEMAVRTLPRDPPGGARTKLKILDPGRDRPRNLRSPAGKGNPDPPPGPPGGGGARTKLKIVLSLARQVSGTPGSWIHPDPW